MIRILALALTLGLPGTASAAGAGCQDTSGPLVLEKVKASAAGSQIIGCINRSLEILSFSTAPSYGSTTTSMTAVGIWASTWAATGHGDAYNVTVSSDAYLKERLQVGTTFYVQNGRVAIGSKDPVSSGGAGVSRLFVTGSGPLTLRNSDEPSGGGGGWAYDHGLLLGGHTGYGWLQTFNGTPLRFNPLGNPVSVGGQFTVLGASGTVNGAFNATGAMAAGGVLTGLSSGTVVGSSVGGLGVGKTGLSGGLLVVRSTDTTAAHDTLRVEQNDGDPIFVCEESGECGIGTASPGSKLHAYTATGDIAVTIENDNAGPSDGNVSLNLDRTFNVRTAQMQFQTAGVTDWYMGILRNAGSPVSNWYLGTGSDVSVTAPALAVIKTGDIGIGTISPATKLHMSSGTLTLDGTAPKIRTGASTDPALSGCGTSPTIVGSDLAGTITVGTDGGGVTACTLTFAATYTTTPACTITGDNTAVTLAFTARSATAFTVSSSADMQGDVLTYICIGVDP